MQDSLGASQESLDFADLDSIMALPNLPEEGISNHAVINPPSSSEEAGAGAEDLPDWCFQPDDTVVQRTPTSNSVTAHVDTVNALLSMYRNPVPGRVEMPSEGMSQAQQPVIRGRGARKRRHKAIAETTFEDPLMARSSPAEILEFAKKYSNLLYPFMLPGVPNAFSNGMVQPERPRTELEPLVVASVEYPSMPHNLLPSPVAPVMDQSDAIPLNPALADQFSIATVPQPTFVPPLGISTVGTTTTVANWACLDESVQKMDLTEIIPESEAQVELTPSSPTIHDLVDLSSPEMTASADPELSFTPFTPQTLGLSGASWGAPHESGSECQLNYGSEPWSPTSDWVSDWCSAIDHMPAIPSDLELPNSFTETPVESPEVNVRPETPKMELELVPKVPELPKTTRRRSLRNQIRHLLEPMLPSLQATFAQMGKRRRATGTSDENPRIVWTKELHRRFEDALTQLGGLASADCTPKNIRTVMNCKLLTNYHVKSHLQSCKTSWQHYQYGSEGSSDDSQLPIVPGTVRFYRKQQARSRLRASSSERMDHQVAQETLAETIAMHQEMQQQLPVLLEKSKELQAQIDMMAKQGEQLQQMSRQLFANQHLIDTVDD